MKNQIEELRTEMKILSADIEARMENINKKHGVVLDIDIETHQKMGFDGIVMATNVRTKITAKI